MKFQKGHAPLPRNPEKQEAKKELKLLIGDLLVDHFDDFTAAWMRLARMSPKAFCDIYVTLLNFSVPKISAVQFDESIKSNPATDLLKEMAQYKKEE